MAQDQTLGAALALKAAGTALHRRPEACSHACSDHDRYGGIDPRRDGTGTKRRKAINGVKIRQMWQLQPEELQRRAASRHRRSNAFATANRARSAEN